MPVRVECSVCVESFTEGQIARCGFCEYNVCKGCVKQWLLALQTDPACMQCHQPYDREQLIAMLGKTFVQNDLKRHRENVLLDREVAMLAETAPHADRELQIRENKKRVLELKEERKKMKQRVSDIENTIRTIESTAVPLEGNEERRQFVHPCSRTGCDGFLQANWKCRKCDGITCKDCGMFKGNDATEAEAHVCNADDLASMEMIRKDSRRCVACGAWTFKIHGCNQMYCVMPGCNTAWDWRTGKRVTGTIHNPEYFRMRREMSDLGRNLGDIPCGGLPASHEITSLVHQGLCSELHVEFTQMIRLVNHINGVEMHNYPDRAGVADNRDLRILLFLGEIERNAMKMRLQQREKRTEKNRHVNQILTMFATTISDMLRQVVISKTAYLTSWHNMTRLIDYTNDQMANVMQLYTCVVPFVYKSPGTLGYWRIVNYRPIRYAQENAP